MEDLENRESAYEAVKKAADDVISKAGTAADPAVRGKERWAHKIFHIKDKKDTSSSSFCLKKCEITSM